MNILEKHGKRVAAIESTRLPGKVIPE